MNKSRELKILQIYSVYIGYFYIVYRIFARRKLLVFYNYLYLIKNIFKRKNEYQKHARNNMHYIIYNFT